MIIISISTKDTDINISNVFRYHSLGKLKDSRFSDICHAYIYLMFDYNTVHNV